MEPDRKIAFILAATDHGSMILNRFDYRIVSEGYAYGVGLSLLETAHYELEESRTIMQLLSQRKADHGDGVVVMDCGANIGTHTILWAKHMEGWGRVIAIEPQEPIYYALCGNIAINNCFRNVQALDIAVGDSNCSVPIPILDYDKPGSFGSLELMASKAEPIGQEVDYTKTVMVEMRTIDSFKLERLDFLKLDVERMELDVLIGARLTIDRLKPIICVEYVKSKPEELTNLLEPWGYKIFPFRMNLVAIHESDPTLKIARLARDEG